MLKKFVVICTLISLLAPTIALADPPSIMDKEELEIVVKDVPKDLKKRLGGDYILVREDYFRELTEAAKQRDVLLAEVDGLKTDLGKWKIHADDLQRIIEEDQAHMARLNGYIDDQQKEIARLQPTVWSRHKFAFGMIAGMLLVGGAAYGASQIK